MTFNIKTFIDKGLKYGGARTSLFNVIFHSLGEEDAERMSYFVHTVNILYVSYSNGPETTQLEFNIFEDEDRFVSDRIKNLSGKVTIQEFSKTGGLRRSTDYDYTTDVIKVGFDWNKQNDILSYYVKGYVDEK